MTCTSPDPLSGNDSSSDLESIWTRLQASLARLATASHPHADPAALAEKLAARAKTLRGQSARFEAAKEVSTIVAFSKGNQPYGIPLTDVLEVQPLDHFTPVPKAPPFLPGVVHWRGSILTLLDLGMLFGFLESGLADVHVYLVSEGAGRRIAVTAREVEEIHAVSLSEIKTPPQLPGNVPPEWIVGVYDDNRLIVKMDLILQDARLNSFL
jgi:purine-binding chemotaxis protein CheW